MTWLQALVVLALFAPGAVAPTASLSIPSLSMFSTAVFAVGVLTTFWAGGLIARIGSPFSGMQLALNTYFVTLGVRELGLSHLEAGVALACAQAGGLAGRLGWGFLAKRIGAARLILAFGGTAALVWGEAR